ncbi:purine nucleoside phosphorylase II [Legionella busanensis]|uniref:Purine nucleoside phosphorylase II n=1 Tax=Legionella busanensis TaxID=190655 RepID=A0A378JNC9_9GAMM|nr:nucleoside phosphorylase [Legionella busanensis]STX51793.1 purine nucleoside phosphorylase II [Legionella busanensis]
MKRKLADTELILSNNKIYHLDIGADDVADTVLTVGDPERVERITRYFDVIQFKHQHREFVTHTGYFNNKRLTVLSTGIGTQNIDIVLNELDALINIDFKSKMVNDKLRSLNIIRLGTTGALQENIALDSFIVASHAIDLTGILLYYKPLQNKEEEELSQRFTSYIKGKLPETTFLAYASDEKIMQSLLANSSCIKGISVTCHGFYTPQGRPLRAGAMDCNFTEYLASFPFKIPLTNLEMETAALYGLSKMLGHRCCSINVAIANRITKKFTSSVHLAEKKLIEFTLEAIAAPS